jgi:hypothetical protein
MIIFIWIPFSLFRRGDDGADPPDQLDAHDRLPKLAHCEKCGLEYVYFLSVANKGFQHLEMKGYSEFVQSDGLADAPRRVKKFMDRTCAPIPCPKCNHYQTDMVRVLRASQYRWMLKLALAMIPLSIVLFIGARITANRHLAAPSDDSFAPMVVFWTLFALAAILVLALPVLRHFLSLAYDPNNDPKAVSPGLFRKRRALSKEDYFLFVSERRQRLEEKRKRFLQ